MLKIGAMRALVYCMLFAFTVMPLDTVAQSISWTSLEKAQQKASQTDKKVFIFAEAQWCGYCQKMYDNTFPETSVQDSLKKYFHPVRIDIESDQKVQFNDQQYTQKKLGRKLNVSATPTIIFVDPDGKILGTQPGYLPPRVLDKLLTYVGQELFNELQFKAYLDQHGVSLENPE